VELGEGESVRSYVVEKFMVVGVFQTSFVCFCDWGAERGDDDYVVRLLLENLLRSSLDEAGHDVSDMFRKTSRRVLQVFRRGEWVRRMATAMKAIEDDHPV